jgi:hypothetical protein
VKVHGVRVNTRPPLTVIKIHYRGEVNKKMADAPVQTLPIFRLCPSALFANVPPYSGDPVNPPRRFI